MLSTNKLKFSKTPEPRRFGIIRTITIPDFRIFWISKNNKSRQKNKAELLPDLVILNIFRHLELADLCRAGRVCKKWYELSRYPKLWKCVKIDVPKYVHVKSLFPHLPPCVKHIYFYHQFPCMYSVPELMIELIDQCPVLEHLSIKGAGMLQPAETLKAKPPVQSSRHLKYLKVFSIRKSVLNNPTFPSEVVTLIPPELPILDLSCCIFPGLPSLLPHLSYLQELYIPQDSPNHFLSRIELSFLRHAKGLKVLDLEGLLFQSRNLIDALTDNIFLEKLYLKNCRIFSDVSVVSFIQLNMFTRLTELCICETGVTSQGIELLFTSCTSLKNLGVDNVQYNKCSEEWKCKKLVFLDTSKKIICDHFTKNHPHDCVTADYF